ncbi:di-heme oxidoredictase family protein [Nonlabens sp. Asnod3-A02]|uniref:di-heme oxidoreductase family protein n=1 Tax=Nonlabens sp. Asnod3-A02 TaxID=3160579 RepID=UPI00386AB2EB
MRVYYKLFILPLLLFITSCNTDDSYTALTAEIGEELSGGDNTSFNFSAEAFGFAAPNLSFEERVTFGVGNSLFNQSWVTAPASTTARDGLGPFFNARNCSGCHFKDGRGRASAFAGELSHGLLLRLSTPGTGVNGGNLPEPTYGGQFQDNSILSQMDEGIFEVVYEPKVVTYSDGTTVSLRNPTYTFPLLNYGAMVSNVQVSPRVANQMIGLGLLEAVPETSILALADQFDTNGDGISGKANYVYDIASGTNTLGRFGWKANQPNLRQQVAGAFAGDIGITSSLFPDENCPTGVDCFQIPNGGTPEIDDTNLDKVTFYSSTLAVPARRNFEDQDVLEGKELFNEISCTSCHVALLQTGNHEIAALSNQTIRPYTDLLLHDMGDDLADNTPDFLATGNEWRTPPLWGTGLIETVNDHTNLLHDGRARNVEEAILWHGGEASPAQERFKELSSSERSKIIAFINSL